MTMYFAVLQQVECKPACRAALENEPIVLCNEEIKFCVTTT